MFPECSTSWSKLGVIWSSAVPRYFGTCTFHLSDLAKNNGLFYSAEANLLPFAKKDLKALKKKAREEGGCR